jgi:host factor-I protein
MAEFDTGTPSVRQIQGFIKDGNEVEIKLLTQDTLLGQLRWQDQYCVCISDQDGLPVMIWRHAIAYMKPSSEGGGGGNRALQVRQ